MFRMLVSVTHDLTLPDLPTDHRCSGFPAGRAPRRRRRRPGPHYWRANGPNPRGCLRFLPRAEELCCVQRWYRLEPASLRRVAEGQANGPPRWTRTWHGWTSRQHVMGKDRCTSMDDTIVEARRFVHIRKCNGITYIIAVTPPHLQKIVTRYYGAPCGLSAIYLGAWIYPTGGCPTGGCPIEGWPRGGCPIGDYAVGESSEEVIP